MSTINTLTIGGHKAVVSLDADLGLLRGEFVGLNGGADFYAKDIDTLIREGEASLAAFMEVCGERGIEPVKKFSGKLQLRLDEAVHANATIAAAARGVSLNQFIADAVRHEMEAA